MASKLAAVFLSVAVVGMLFAWQLQSSAARLLGAALQIGEAEVSESGAEPASVDDYRAIVASLERSIAIRSEIDGLLSDVEEIVGDLNRTQERAIETARVTRAEVARIGRILGGSVDASRASLDGLQDLRRRLRRSAVLGRLIADELEELDESLGPPVVLP